MKQEEMLKVGVVAACLVKQDDKYLMVREQPPGSGVVWNLPAGHVDVGETIEQGAIRETKEETNYDVELIEHIGIYHKSEDASVKHVYSAKIIGGEAKPQAGEILGVEWLSFDEIAKLNDDSKLRKPWVWDAIEKFENS